MKKAKATTKAAPRLKPGMDQLAADWLAATNLGYPGKPPKDVAGLRQVSFEVRSNPDEAPGAMDDEGAHWLREIRRGDPFTLGELLRELPWIFEAGS